MSDSWYYDFCNPDHAIKEYILKQGIDESAFKYLKDIVDVNIGMFRYDNLPKDLTSDIVEIAMTFMPNLCWYESNSLGFILCKFIPDGTRNLYGKPKRVRLEALNGMAIASNISYEDIVVLKDNSMGLPPILTMMQYIQQIMRIEDGMFKVLNIATLPIALIGDKKQASALKQVASNLGYKNPFIVGDSKLLDQVQSFDIKVPINPLDIYDLKSKYRNECLASLGIYSVEQKRERIVTQELRNQNDYVDFIYTARVNQRNESIAKCNAKFGTNIKMIETYDINVNATIEEEARKAKAVAVAENVGGKNDGSKS